MTTESNQVGKYHGTLWRWENPPSVAKARRYFGEQ